jgi:hypothetical protein
MSLREEILKEHSKKHALHIATLACASKKDFKELVIVFYQTITGSRRSLPGACIGR